MFHYIFYFQHMDIYGEIILDHYRNPHHYGRLEKATLSAKDVNPLCGDSIQIDLLIDGNNTIQDIAFTAQGCAISQASASMLSDILIGKSLKFAAQICSEDIYEMVGVPLSPARIKCALLGLSAIKKAITLQYVS